jgi:AraC family transcriptional regulator, regulatory protein of adaptative response / methylated-DNA-[protein]-cysteine methyltransferase
MKTLPAPARMYRALVERDASYDGLFFVGVKTTGIFCRPTCPARKPNRENVEFFGDAEAASSAGFRACKRCRPLEVPGEHPEWVARLLARVEAGARSGGERISDEALRELGVEPVAARRYFRDRFGLTFQAYQRSRRLGLAQESIASGVDVTSVAFDAGFESQSGFRDAFAKVFGVPPGRARGKSHISATLIHTPIGGFVAAALPGKVCLLEFADRPALLSQTASLRRWFDEPIVPGRNDALEQLREELAEYFAGTRRAFDVPLAIAGTPFQESVWRGLLAIPYGATRSYEEMAHAIGRAGAQRAVGKANGDNRLAVLVPCHRVIEKSGKLRGYSGGLWRKKYLLEHELAVIG